MTIAELGALTVEQLAAALTAQGLGKRAIEAAVIAMMRYLIAVAGKDPQAVLSAAAALREAWQAAGIPLQAVPGEQVPYADVAGEEALGTWAPMGPPLEWAAMRELNQRMASALKGENVIEGLQIALAAASAAGVM